jgi:serine/threonine protein kinase
MAVDRADPTDVPDLDTTPYRYVREIGRGGMGSVHLVEHLALGKRFVMKVLHEKLAHREDFALRMRSEWRILAKLEHPAIVQVTDAGRTRDGLPFFVMERLEGQTVAEALQTRGRWLVLEAAELMIAVLSGLEAAHAAGAIHRDIKPQNLFLTVRGPKILDFGIVKSKRKRAAFVTRSGIAIGTPRYMAPEQAAGLTVDARTDIYACALVLFEMIAGRDPYAHLGDQAALVSAQINEPAPRLDDVRPDVPAPLGDLLQRWLAKDAADRPASARLARLELEALIPLLRTVSTGPISQPVSSEERTRGPDESTAGATNDSALLPPTATSSIRALGSGGFETATLEADSPLSIDALVPDAASIRAPSVTPPPLMGPGHGSRRPPQRHWLWASLGLLSVVTLGLGTLVLHPEWAPSGHSPPRSASLAGPAFDFPETNAGGPVVAENVPATASPQDRLPDKPTRTVPPGPPPPRPDPPGTALPEPALPGSESQPRRAQARAPRPEPISTASSDSTAPAGDPVRDPTSGGVPRTELPSGDLPGSGLW